MSLSTAQHHLNEIEGQREGATDRQKTEIQNYTTVRHICAIMQFV